MISRSLAIKVHESVIEEFGGSHGVRDLGLLESALSRPFQTFDGIELHPDVYSKAAALLESILINHPFIDGNKRIAFILMNIILQRDKIFLNTSQDKLYEFIINIIISKPSIEGISTWLKQNSNRHG